MWKLDADRRRPDRLVRGQAGPVRAQTADGHPLATRKDQSPLGMIVL